MLTRFVYVFLIIAVVMGCSFDEPAPVTAKFQTTGGDCTAPCTVTFTDMSENKGVYNWQYKWTLPGGEVFSTSENATHKFDNPGEYRITLTLHNDKYGTSTFEDTVSISAPKPVAAFDFSNAACEAPCEMTFTNKSQNATSYLWSFGDGSKADSVQSPKHLFAEAGTFKVTLYAMQGTVKDSVSKMVTILPEAEPPIADFTFKPKQPAPTTVAVDFVNTSKNANKFLWDFGGGKTDTTFSPTYTFAREAVDKTYVVTLIASKGMLADTVRKDVKISKK